MATTHPSLPSCPLVDVSASVVGRRAVLTVDGEIDIGTVGIVAAAIDRAVADGAVELWLDLAPTSFMDSAGLHLLLDTGQRLEALNRELAIIAPPASVRRLFEVAGVTGLLTVHPDRQSAHASR
jgi:anti-anti-sigma factor